MRGIKVLRDFLIENLQLQLGKSGEMFHHYHPERRVVLVSVPELT